MQEETPAPAKAPERNGELAPFLVMVLAAVVLVASFFLPYASMTEEGRELASAAGSVYLEELGMSYGDMVDLSLMEYAKTYATMGGLYLVYVVLYIAAVALSAVTLLLAALKKPIGAIVFAALTFAASLLIRWDFSDRNVIPGSAYDWGIASWLYLVAAVVVIAAAIWMLVIRKRVKAECS